ncbi:MAG: PUR family DNA/RNA-binding protein [Paludibacteraceae bacterium]|nr:PUR family DNA/RNA-binding protein [Paludibacteraceae bacterium]
MINLFNRTPKEEPSRVQREDREDKEIVFSKAVKAGKRVYYLDVKKDRRGDLFLSVTESKRKSVTEDGQFIFEKHKIFLYKEDFDKFEEAMTEVLSYMRKAMPVVEPAEGTEAEVESDATVEEPKAEE